MGNCQQHRSRPLARSLKTAFHCKGGGLIAAALLSGILAGCASQDLEPPVAQMARAEASIETAIQAGARDTAPLELQSAERHLSQAQLAVANEEYREALWLAEKSEADADLAETKARTERTYETVAELKEGLRVLEGELERESPLDSK